MDSCTSLCLQLLASEVEKDCSNNNVVLSPLSFQAVLNLMAAGATGQTLNQLLKFLGAKDPADMKAKFADTMNAAAVNNKGVDDDNTPKFYLVNGIWVHSRFPLKDSYKEFVKKFCKSEAQSFDFATQAEELVEAANVWAKNETNGLIPSVLQPGDINPSDLCLLANALYFKGTWVDRLRWCGHYDFYLLNGEKVSEVDFMTSYEKYFHGYFDGFQAVKMPYQQGPQGDNNQFAMYVFLPYEVDGFGSMLKKMGSTPGFFKKDFGLRSRSFATFHIPKFNFSYETDQGREVMKMMGLTLPFDEQCLELTEMIEFPSNVPFYCSGVIQKARIDVNEKGTEAAAITLLSLRGGGGPPPPEETFEADHPFVFMIREELSKLVLFIGALLNPCGSNATRVPLNLPTVQKGRKSLAEKHNKKVLGQGFEVTPVQSDANAASKKDADEVRRLKRQIEEDGVRVERLEREVREVKQRMSDMGKLLSSFSNGK